MNGTLLVTGGAGYLGRRVLALARHHAQNQRVIGTTNRTPVAYGESIPLDLANEKLVWATLDALQPQAIIHTAAITPALGSAMTDAALWNVNVRGTAALARWASHNQARLVHVSSDAIWGGRDAPYTEIDLPAPISPYGASKAAAEAVVQALYPAAAIARTSLIYGFDPPDPNTTMALQLLSGQRSGVLFTDEFRCPVFIDDLALALLELANSDQAGIFHLVGPHAISRYELGAALVRWHGFDPATLPAGTTASSGLRRPSRVVVDANHTQNQIRTVLRDVATVTNSEVRDGTDTRSPRSIS